MPIDCSNNTRPWWKSVSQTVSIGTMLLMFLFMILPSLVGLLLFGSFSKHNDELCDNLKISRPVKGSLLAPIFTVLAISFGIMFVAVVYSYGKKKVPFGKKWWPAFLPLILSVTSSTKGQRNNIRRNGKWG
jgi:hypothetical protein